MAIEELVAESKKPASMGGEQRRKRLDVAAHRMVLNTLASNFPKRSNGSS